jgi:hypothetical protein
VGYLPGAISVAPLRRETSIKGRANSIASTEHLVGVYHSDTIAGIVGIWIIVWMEREPLDGQTGVAAWQR